MIIRNAPYLVGAGDDLRELIGFLLLTLDHGFQDGGVIGAQVDEDMGDAGLFS